MPQILNKRVAKCADVNAPRVLLNQRSITELLLCGSMRIFGPHSRRLIQFGAHLQMEVDLFTQLVIDRAPTE